MKAFYIAEDSGRELVGGLVLAPGIEYSVVDAKVGYGPGVKVIDKPLAEKLASRNILKLVEDAPEAKAKATVTEEKPPKLGV